MVCHEVVCGGRATFRYSLGIILWPGCVRILTTVSVRGRRGIVVGGYSVSMLGVSAHSRQQQHRSRTHVTNSLSVLVVRVSGALPKRPMRMSFARSDADGLDDENACKLENIRQHSGDENSDIHGTQRVGQQENEKGTSFRWLGGGEGEIPHVTRPRRFLSSRCRIPLTQQPRRTAKSSAS